MVKRFKIETSKLKERYSFLTDHAKSKLLFASVKENPRIKYTLKINGKPMTGEVALGDFMDVKGWKAVGNRLSDQLLGGIKEIELSEAKLLPKAEAAPLPPQQINLFDEPDEAPSPAPKTPDAPAPESPDKKIFRAGDTIEFD
jgi:topoisomerase-4 subunit A